MAKQEETSKSAKIRYRPIGLTSSILGGLLAGIVFKCRHRRALARRFGPGATGIPSRRVRHCAWMRRRLLPRDQSAGAVGLYGPRQQLPDVQGDRGATGTSWRRARAGPRAGHSAGTRRRPPLARPSIPPQLSTRGRPRRSTSVNRFDGQGLVDSLDSDTRQLGCASRHAPPHAGRDLILDPAARR